MKIQQLQDQAMVLCLELKQRSNQDYKAQIIKCHSSPTFHITYFGRGSDNFQLWLSSNFTEYAQKQYLERNIVRLGQIKKELFGG